MMKGNKEFIEAVKEEYQNVGTGSVTLEADIQDKWFLSTERKVALMALLQ